MFENDRLSLLGKLLIITGVITTVLSYFLWKNNNHISNFTTLASIQDRGYLKCGVASNSPGLSIVDRNSILTAKERLRATDKELTLYTESVGLESDLCRAVAIGLFGTSENTLFFHVADGNWNTRMESVVNDDIDLLIRQVAIQPELGSTHPVDFSPVVYYDRMALLASNTISDSKSLKGISICALQNTQPESAAQHYTEKHNLDWRLVSSHADEFIQSYNHAVDALLSATCEAIAGRFSSLYSLAVNNKKVSDYHLLDLPDTASVPTVAVVKNSSHEFKALVNHSIWTLIRAVVNRQSFTKVSPEYNANYWRANKLNTDYPRRIIQQLGNYSDIYQRHFADIQSDAGPNTHYFISEKGRLQAPR